MPMTIKIRPTVAMLTNRPRRLTLQGLPLIAQELRVRDVGTLEARALKMFPHPLATVAAQCRELRESRARGESVMSPQNFRPLFLPIMRASERWPPRYGTIEFDRYAGSSDGMRSFLWLVLRRKNPGLDRTTCDELAALLDYEEWDAVSDAGWGRPDLGGLEEVPTPPGPGDAEDSEDARAMDTGIDWAGHFSELEKSRGWRREYILGMPISRFFACLGGGSSRKITVADPTDVGGDSASAPVAPPSPPAAPPDDPPAPVQDEWSDELEDDWPDARDWVTPD